MVFDETVVLGRLPPVVPVVVTKPVFRIDLFSLRTESKKLKFVSYIHTYVRGRDNDRHFRNL